MFMVAGRLVVGSDWPGRGLGAGGTTTTSAIGAARHRPAVFVPLGIWRYKKAVSR
jgi:hypothetical protein